MKSLSCNSSKQVFFFLHLVVDGPDLRQLGPVVGVLDAGGLDLEKREGEALEFCFDFVCIDRFKSRVTTWSTFLLRDELGR